MRMTCLPMKIDYEKIGVKVGLEIHQQLNTATKLFCNCKPELFKTEPEITFIRRLRPTQSELGQIDPAAYFEFQKGLKILYEANTATSCLVEMDEEPPHPLNAEAVEIALTVAMMTNAKPVEEIHTMRKTVIDGSNTTGFQRTCVVAVDGEIKVGEKTIPLQHIGLEEDAARKTGEENNTIRYRTDRLGIPLIEVATAPVIKSPKEAGEVAFAIGTILRATGKVMRGLGAIRQDINISIPNGALTEIKGVQELELISLIVKYEAQRQLNLIKISEELKEKAAKEREIREEFFDVTDVFKQTKCRVIRKALDKNQLILAVKLPRFKGFLKRELMPNFRLGTEMADRARFWGRVGGIFHTDEMPAYGITTEETEMLKKTVKAEEEEDAVVFVADSAENARDALKAVVDRAREAVSGVPEETRAANPDGTTRYMRPRPGAARMYPETDIPPTLITEELIKKLSLNLPETSEHKLRRLMEEYGLNKKLARQIIDSAHAALFETIARESGVSPTTTAVFLTETLKALKRDRVEVEKVSENLLREVFKSLGSGQLTKEALPEIITWLSVHEDKSLQEATRSLGLKMLSREELEKMVDNTVAANKQAVTRLGMNAFGMLMGLVMKEVRGKANVELVAEVVRKKLELIGNERAVS